MDTELIAIYEKRLPRYTSYPTAPHFHPGVDAATYGRWLEATAPGTAASLYLHVPFCEAMCWYCGCHTTVAKSYAPVGRYAELLAREIEMVAAALSERVSVRHIHWGGGTPNVLSAGDLRQLCSLIRERFDVMQRAELAIEIDPRRLDREKARALGEAGFTRASLGVQDFDPAVQEAIHRHQPYEVTARAAQLLREHGIDEINFDLIYGLPRQTTAGLGRTIDRALALAPSRIALFGYAHVPWMKPHQRRIPDEALPGTAERVEQYFAASDRIAAGGYCRLGLDHFARPGDSLAAAAASGALHRNFQGYTTDAAPLLIGLGASAIGSLPQGYVQNDPSIAGWRERIAGNRFATCRGIAFTSGDRLRGAIIERLMCALEVDLAIECARYGQDPSALASECAEVDDLAGRGIAWREGWRVGVSEAQRPLIRLLCAVVDEYLDTAALKHSRAI